MCLACEGDAPSLSDGKVGSGWWEERKELNPLRSSKRAPKLRQGQKA